MHRFVDKIVLKVGEQKKNKKILIKNLQLTSGKTILVVSDFYSKADNKNEKIYLKTVQTLRPLFGYLLKSMAGK